MPDADLACGLVGSSSVNSDSSNLGGGIIVNLEKQKSPFLPLALNYSDKCLASQVRFLTTIHRSRF